MTIFLKITIILVLIEEHTSNNLENDAKKFFEGRRNRIEDYDDAHARIQTWKRYSMIKIKK